MQLGQYQQPQFYQTLTPSPQQQAQYPSFPQQQSTYPVPGQQLPLPPQKAPKKPVNKKLVIGVSMTILVLIIVIAAAAGSANQSSSSTPTAQTTSTSDQSTPIDQSTPTVDQSTPTPQPTVVTPTPTASAAEVEAAYKASTTDTTITKLDKGGNADSGQDVHFTASILNFVKKAVEIQQGLILMIQMARQGWYRLPFLQILT